MKKDIISIVEHSKVMHPIATAATTGNRYWYDFLKVIENYKGILSEQDYIKFLDKSKLDCEIDMAQYLQFASEVTIVDYIIRNYESFKNEPRYNGKKNPECSFEYGGRTINIEVKCPNMSKRIEQESLGGIKLFASERFPDKESYEQAEKTIMSTIKDAQSVHTINRLDNKLKDYLNSAHQKFPPSSTAYFNILVIALDIIPDMDEWYSYLLGDKGAFTNTTYIKDDYSNVDAVLITNVQHGHTADNVNLSINCWELENYVSLLILDPRKEQIEGLGKYYFQTALDLFGGLTRNFLEFQLDMDQKNEVRSKHIKHLRLDGNQEAALHHFLYIEDKFTDLQIVSRWTETLKYGCNILD